MYRISLYEINQPSENPSLSDRLELATVLPNTVEGEPTHAAAGTMDWPNLRSPNLKRGFTLKPLPPYLLLNLRGPEDDRLLSRTNLRLDPMEIPSLTPEMAGKGRSPSQLSDRDIDQSIPSFFSFHIVIYDLSYKPGRTLLNQTRISS